MTIITTASDLRTWVANNSPGNAYAHGDVAIRAVSEALRSAEHPPWGEDWAGWLEEHAERVAIEAMDAANIGLA